MLMLKIIAKTDLVQYVTSDISVEYTFSECVGSEIFYYFSYPFPFFLCKMLCFLVFCSYQIVIMRVVNLAQMFTSQHFKIQLYLPTY